MNRYNLHQKHKPLPKSSYFRKGDRWMLNSIGLLNNGHTNLKYPLSIEIVGHELDDPGRIIFADDSGRGAMDKDKIMEFYDAMGQR